MLVSGCGAGGESEPESSDASAAPSESVSESAKEAPSESAEPSAEAEEFDVETASLSDKPFCEELDRKAVAELVGKGATDLQVKQVKVGQKVAPFPGATKEPSRVNSCEYAADAATVGLAIAPFYDEGAARSLLDSVRQDKRCEVEQPSHLGDLGYTAVCRPTDNEPYGYLMFATVVGQGRFACVLNTQPGSPLGKTLAGRAESFFAFCDETLQATAS